MKHEVIETIDPPNSYYQNQAQDEHGEWRDVAPAYSRSQDAKKGATALAMETARPVRVVRFSK